MRIGRVSRDRAVRPARQGRLARPAAVLLLSCLPCFAAAQQEPPSPDAPNAEADSQVVETPSAQDPADAGDESAGSQRPAPVIRLEPLPPPEPPTWPGVPRLAEAMADQALRDDVLLTIATLLTLRDVPPSADGEAAAVQVQRLLADRAWLDTLIERYGYAEARSPVLDPAAWQVQVQLDRVSLPPTTLASPLGSGQDVLLSPVFDRGNPDLAAASLPELLWSLEASAPRTWVGLQRRLASDPWLADALMRTAGDWFDWPEPETPEDATLAASAADGGLTDEAGAADPEAADLVGPVLTLSPKDRLLDEAQTSLGVMLELASDVGPPDPARLARVRRDLLVALPDFDFGQRARAEGLLHLAGLVDGPPAGRSAVLPRADPGLCALAGPGASGPVGKLRPFLLHRRPGAQHRGRHRLRRRPGPDWRLYAGCAG